MPPHLNWSPGARAVFDRLHWHDAERVDAAVLRFVERGEGDFEPVHGDPYGLRLRAPGYIVALEIKGGGILVLDVYRAL
jgi:hypothetical protein